LMGGLTEEDETAVEDELAEMISQSLPSVPSEEPEQMEGVEVPESPVKGALVLMLLFVT
jgi:hypothetical protein